MDTYSSITQDIARQETMDPVTWEDFKTDEKAHPRAVMTIRRSNGVPYPYLVSTVMRLIRAGQPEPVTRAPFSAITKKRAELYSECMQVFPDYTLEDLDTVDLFRRWQETFNPFSQLSEEQKEHTRLEARCFLQAEDLLTIFKKYQGKGSNENRAKAMDDVAQGYRWILRNSSVRDTEYEKAYALTRNEGRVCHYLIIHKIGDGFYYNVKNIGRGESAGKFFICRPDFAVYPTIIQLLEGIIA